MQLWQYLPRWIISIFETKVCSHCDELADKKDIVAVGVRIVEGSTDKYTLYVEHACSHCRKRVITSFSKEKQCSVEDLCYMLIEQMQHKKELDKSRTLSDHGKNETISDEEVKELSDFMGTNDSHEEFMKFIHAFKLPKDKKDED